MIDKILKFHRDISIEFKVLFGVFFFILLLGSVERYQLFNNVSHQFFKAKKSKNLLLVNTISPILALNISFGLDNENKDYLDYIAKQNPDITFIELKDSANKIVYEYANNEARRKHEMGDKKEAINIDFSTKEIQDPTTNEVIGSLHLHFSDSDFLELQLVNRSLTFKLALLAFVFIFIFLILVKREFKYLRRLSASVLSYDPKLNNFSLPLSDRRDEVGVIQNAIISMVDKISSYTKILDETNISLEEKVKERTKKLQEANKRLNALSTTDELTQLSNRRYYETYFQKTWELAKRKRVKISLIMCDIDYFKKVNDSYGHQVGDEVLKAVSKALGESLKRKSDFVARYGGEEFIIVMYEADFQDARVLSQRIQENLKKGQNIVFQGKQINPVTMSFGISCITPSRDDNSEILLKNADDALYQAKDNGRNCIVSFEAP